MPDCGRRLNVGRAGKRRAPPEYGPVQPRQRCAALSGSTGSERNHATSGKPARWTPYRVSTWTRAVEEVLQNQYCLLASLKRNPAINWLQTVGAPERQHPPWILTGKSADLILLSCSTGGA
jgi:hypothetical protein